MTVTQEVMQFLKVIFCILLENFETFKIKHSECPLKYYKKYLKHKLHNISFKSKISLQ